MGPDPRTGRGGARQAAGRPSSWRLSKEEEAILQREATLAAELRQDRERQERRASRAGAGVLRGAGAVALRLSPSACLAVLLPPPTVLAPPPPPLAGCLQRPWPAPSQ